MDVLLHSYTFRNDPFETAVQYAQRFGYDGVELSRVHCHDSRFAEDLPHCIGIAAKYGVEVRVAGFKADLVSESEKVVYDSVSRLEENIKLCNENGVYLLNGFIGVLQAPGHDYPQNGSALATDDMYDRAADSLRYLAGICSGQGVALALEIHMNTPHDTVESMRRVLDAVNEPQIQVTADPANSFAVSNGEFGVSDLKAVEDSMALFHFKNCRRNGGVWDYSVRLSEGFVDTYAYLRYLDDIQFRGPVCLEYVGEGDPRAAARDDIAYFYACRELIRDGLD